MIVSQPSALAIVRWPLSPAVQNEGSSPQILATARSLESASSASR
ncbi:MAG TPA: hypothetical protein VLU06_01110 [Thermoanaerobaculia bacterium]|nr:hypothetical protein [Thermoanaerobaculia bacterium]